MAGVQARRAGKAVRGERSEEEDSGWQRGTCRVLQPRLKTTTKQRQQQQQQQARLTIAHSPGRRCPASSAAAPQSPGWSAGSRGMSAPAANNQGGRAGAAGKGEVSGRARSAIPAGNQTGARRRYAHAARSSSSTATEATPSAAAPASGRLPAGPCRRTARCRGGSTCRAWCGQRGRRAGALTRGKWARPAATPRGCGGCTPVGSRCWGDRR